MTTLRRTTLNRRTRVTSILACAAATLTALTVLSATSAGQTTATQSAQPDRSFETVDDLLIALEDAGSDIRTLTANIRYTRVFALEGDEQVRDGTLWYLHWPEGPPNDDGVRKPAERGFSIEFTRARMGERIDDVSRRYAFDGEWLLETDGETRVATRQQVVPPGQTFDPLRLGEGPFPVPIGQKREQIVERFDAELVETTENIWDETLELIVTAKPTYQLKLTPKPKYASDIELAEIRLWYPADTLLPRLAWTQSLDGNESWILLTQVKVNDALPPDATSTVPPAGDWDVQIMPYRDTRRTSAQPDPMNTGAAP